MVVIPTVLKTMDNAFKGVFPDQLCLSLQANKELVVADQKGILYHSNKQ